MVFKISPKNFDRIEFILSFKSISRILEQHVGFLVKRSEQREWNVSRSEFLFAEMIVHRFQSVHYLVNSNLAFIVTR